MNLLIISARGIKGTFGGGIAKHLLLEKETRHQDWKIGSEK